MDIEKTLISLSNIVAVTSQENEVIKFIKKFVEENIPEAEIFYEKDRALIVKIGSGNKKVAFFSHIDEIGVVITKILDDEYVRVEAVGGIDPKVLISKRLVFSTKEGEKIGVVGKLAPHLMKPEDKGKETNIDSLFVDFSISGGTKGLKVGDIGTWYAKAQKLENSKITGKALDNRSSVLALLIALNELRKIKLNSEVYFVFNGGEEFGVSHAFLKAFEIFPDYGIVVDVTFAEASELNFEKIEMGKGPVIGIGPAINSEVFDFLKNLAEKYSIPYQLESLPMGTGTDTDMVQMVKSGIKTGLISIPLYNMHTPVEIVDISDIQKTGLLLSLFASNVEEMERGEKK